MTARRPPPLTPLGAVAAAHPELLRPSATRAAGTAGAGGRVAVSVDVDGEPSAARARRTSPPGFPRDLVERAAELDLADESVHLAWELLRGAPPLEPAEERAAFVLVLATLGAQRSGSTRLPVAGAAGALFDRIAERLGADPAIARRLLDHGRLGALVGAPGHYAPLVRDGDWLYHHRLHHHEERLADALSARLARPPFPVERDAARAALDELLARPPLVGDRPLELSPQQQYAVLTAAHAPLAVITGGPGTGKTSIVVSVLRLLVRLGVPVEGIALAAPTGKAAQRMKDAIHGSLASLGTTAPALVGGAARDDADARLAAGLAEPTTLHRLLGYSPHTGRFRRHEHDPIAASAVIVDEGSMIDLFLMDRLVRSVRPDARLVLLGDAEQLPSVDAGAVFRDLVPRGPGAGWMPWRELLDGRVDDRAPGALDVPAGSRPDDARWRAAVRLSHSYRMDATRDEGRAILTVARHVNEGRGDRLFAPPRKTLDLFERPLVGERVDAESVRFSGVELLDAPGDAAGARAAFFDRWYRATIGALDDHARLARGTFHFGPDGPTAADAPALARLFEHLDRARLLCVTRGGRRPTGAEAVNRALAAIHRRAIGTRVEGDDLGAGEPVMMRHNDYARGLWNGDSGVVLWVAAAGDAGPGGGGDRGDGDRGASVARPMAVFRREGGFVAFHVDLLRRSLDHAFALTVHKAQGSEFDRVALLLPDDDLPLFSREILYTAVTRARSSVVLVGARALLLRGIGRTIERHSGVAERLADA